MSETIRYDVGSALERLWDFDVKIPDKKSCLWQTAIRHGSFPISLAKSELSLFAATVQALGEPVALTKIPRPHAEPETIAWILPLSAERAAAEGFPLGRRIQGMSMFLSHGVQAAIDDGTVSYIDRSSGEAVINSTPHRGVSLIAVPDRVFTRWAIARAVHDKLAA